MSDVGTVSEPYAVSMRNSPAANRPTKSEPSVSFTRCFHVVASGAEATAGASTPAPLSPPVSPDPAPPSGGDADTAGSDRSAVGAT
jgi:hypothetical protein